MLTKLKMRVDFFTLYYSLMKTCFFSSSFGDRKLSVFMYRLCYKKKKMCICRWKIQVYILVHPLMQKKGQLARILLLITIMKTLGYLPKYI